MAGNSVVVFLALQGEAPVGYVSAVRQSHLWSGGDILAVDDLDTRRAVPGGPVSGTH